VIFFLGTLRSFLANATGQHALLLSAFLTLQIGMALVHEKVDKRGVRM